MMHTYNPEAEAGGSLVQNQPGLHRRLHGEIKKKKKKKQKQTNESFIEKLRGLLSGRKLYCRH